MGGTFWFMKVLGAIEWLGGRRRIGEGWEPETDTADHGGSDAELGETTSAGCIYEGADSGLASTNEEDEEDAAGIDKGCGNPLPLPRLPGVVLTSDGDDLRARLYGALTFGGWS